MRISDWSSDVCSSDLQTAGDLDRAKAFSFNNFPELRGANTTKEAFGEVLIPLLSDVPGFQSLKFNGDARFTDDRPGSICSWKLGLTNQVTTGVELRATTSRNIRSTNLPEPYTVHFLNLLTITHPHTHNNN